MNARHAHVADHTDGQGGERCAVCGDNFRNPIHLTAEQFAGRQFLGQSRDYAGFAGMTAAEQETA